MEAHPSLTIIKGGLRSIDQGPSIIHYFIITLEGQGCDARKGLQPSPPSCLCLSGDVGIGEGQGRHHTDWGTEALYGASRDEAARGQVNGCMRGRERGSGVLMDTTRAAHRQTHREREGKGEGTGGQAAYRAVSRRHTHWPAHIAGLAAQHCQQRPQPPQDTERGRGRERCAE